MKVKELMEELLNEDLLDYEIAFVYHHDADEDFVQFEDERVFGFSIDEIDYHKKIVYLAR